ncbi:MAG: GNAT family N-acetyltransferase [Nitrolancea sp.]
MAHLETPSVRWQASFLDALAEFHGEGTLLNYEMIALRRDFPAFVRLIVGYSRGERLPPGFIPSTDFWLIDDDEFIGRVSIRHELTEGLRRIGGHIGYQIRPTKRRLGHGTRILALALPKARELGLTRVLVTCDETNIGSRKIIEANGGEFENAVDLEDGSPRKLRYWIQIDTEIPPSSGP